MTNIAKEKDLRQDALGLAPGARWGGRGIYIALDPPRGGLGGPTEAECALGEGSRLGEGCGPPGGRKGVPGRGLV
eukprot:1651331-Pyramimonas_sp.AAC.1